MSKLTVLSKNWSLLALAAVLITVLVAMSGATAIHSVDPATKISACVNKSSGEIKIVDADDDCKKNEDPISWPLDVGGEIQADGGFTAGTSTISYINSGIRISGNVDLNVGDDTNGDGTINETIL